MVVFGLMISPHIDTEVWSIMKALVPVKLFNLVHLKKWLVELFKQKIH